MYLSVIPYLSAGPLNRDQVVSELRRVHPSADLGDTMEDCPFEDGWYRCMCGSKTEVVYKTCGPNGGLHAIGLSIAPERDVVSYGTAAGDTCCDRRPELTRP